MSLHDRIVEDVNLFAAINDHVNWASRLQAYLDGKAGEHLDPMVVCCDDQCVLGAWIHSIGLKDFYLDDTFHQLRSCHARFHVLASKVIQHVLDNERAAAEALLNGEYRQALRKLVQALTKLS